MTVNANSNSNIHGFYEGTPDYLYQRKEVKLQWLQVWTESNVKNLNVQESHVYFKNKTKQIHYVSKQVTNKRTKSIEHSPSQKLTALQIVKKLPAFYATKRFITAFTTIRRLSRS